MPPFIYLRLLIFSTLNILLFITWISANGQNISKRYYNWYFGDKAAVTFATNPPSALEDSEMRSWEGCASVSDTAGSLLFYAHGGAVWDATHQVMLNGDGLMSGTITTAGGSGSQSTLIVPLPGNDSLFYLFTTTDLGTDPGAIYYSIINMNGNNGLGEITADKNILLEDSIGEKTAIARHCNGIDYWVLSHGRNNNLFYAWHLSKNGITDTVISGVGSIYQSCAGDGYMKAAPNSKKIASAVIADCLSGIPGFIELYDFDNATGVVSNPQRLPDVLHPYGLEFSPDHSKLFAGTQDKLYQYDLLTTSGNPLTTEQIISSEYTRNLSGSHQALQLAPDNKIYIANPFKNTLHIIDDPNTGIDSYIPGGLNLGIGANQLGLPNYVNENYVRAQLTVSNTNVCVGEMITFTNTSINFPESQIWYFGDGASSVEKHTQHSYELPGVYTVQLIVSSYCEPLDTFIQLITVTEYLLVDASPGKTINTGDTVRLDVTTSGENIQWSPSFSLSCSDCPNPMAIPEETTIYYVTVTNNTGCSGTDSVKITVERSCGAYIPNAFSPNGDGKNDFFQQHITTPYNIKIYDRLGGILFDSGLQYNKYWDGKVNGEAAPGNYIYVINTGACGVIKGNVVIIN